MSPTARSLALLRELGYVADVVERRIPYTNKTHDFLNCLDIIALGPEGQTVGVQATSLSNVSARVRKVADSEHIAAIRRAGWIVWVWGWGKGANGRFRLREVDCS